MGKNIYIYIIFYLFILLIFFSSLISLEFRDAFFRKVECKACTDEVRLMSAISIFPAFTSSSFQIWGEGMVSRDFTRKGTHICFPPRGNY